MRKTLLGLSVVIAICAIAACGYALAGRGNTLPTHIRIIGVPEFTNQSRTPDLDHLLSEAVRQEWQTRGRYRVLTESAGTDAVLTATIQPLVLTPTEFTPARLASKYTITLVASVQFVDQKDQKVLSANPSFRVTEDYMVPDPTNTADPTALFGADKNALERLAKTFARNLVTSILEAF